MAVNKLISIKAAVLSAFGDMGVDHGKDIPTFTRWAAWAEREIGSYFSLRRAIYPIKVNKWRACLPLEAQYVQRVFLGNFGKDSNIFDLFNVTCNDIGKTISFTQTDTFLVVDRPQGMQDIIVGPMQWEVQDNDIVFSDNFDGQIITAQCLSLQMDEEGFPMVCENHLEAITEYIMYRYAKRSRFSPNKMELGDVFDLRKQWGILAAEARAVDSEMSEADRDEIKALLHDPISGYGLQLGMHNRDDVYGKHNNFTSRY